MSQISSNLQEYQENHTLSLKEPDTFWSNIAKNDFYFHEPWTSVCSYNFDIKKGPIFQKWFEGSKTNLTYNCLDRHLDKRKDQVAFYWEGNDPKNFKSITYGELFTQVCKFANVLKSLGCQKGDRVAIYLPMVLELVVTVLACARIGVVHSVVFGGFSAESLANRILDSTPRLLVTADGVYRGNKTIQLKNAADEAHEICLKNNYSLQNMIVLNNLGEWVTYKDGFHLDYDVLMEKADSNCDVVWNDAEDPLFMLYTSGSTGKPKAILHTTAGYMVYVGTTFRNVFDYKDDIYWSTADIGWITGHSYLVYGPLLNGATSVMFEGIPTWPHPTRMWEIIDKYQVSIFYTAPTLIRSLMSMGNHHVQKCKRTSLRLLGTVGEPINPEAWNWYHEIVGDGRCEIVDTYWQTETGGFLITPIPGIIKTKPGSATLPFYGINPIVLDEKSNILKGKASGYLVIDQPWPGMSRTVYGDHTRYENTYFANFPGYYMTGDGCTRDEDGYFWITGRIDDVLNVSGHRLGSAEIESALVSNKNVAEAAVVPVPHDIHGESIYAYVTVKEGVQFSDDLKKELIHTVRKVLGPIATPHTIHWAPGLPKTRSGKIMRRILRKIATKDDSSLGDISTLADPNVVQTLIEYRDK